MLIYLTSILRRKVKSPYKTLRDAKGQGSISGKAQDLPDYGYDIINDVIPLSIKRGAISGINCSIHEFFTSRPECHDAEVFVVFFNLLQI